MKIVVSGRADVDVAEAIIWYETSEYGAGNRFQRALESTYRKIAESPGGFPEVEPGIRKRRTDAFPYLVYYRVLGDRIEILRVVHGFRHPETWREET